MNEKEIRIDQDSKTKKIIVDECFDIIMHSGTALSGLAKTEIIRKIMNIETISTKPSDPIDKSDCFCEVQIVSVPKTEPNFKKVEI